MGGLRLNGPKAAMYTRMFNDQLVFLGGMAWYELNVVELKVQRCLGACS